MRRPELIVALLLLATPLQADDTPRHTLVGKHYRLDYEGSRTDADTALRVLEAAWPQYTKFFGAAPRLRGDDRLKVVFRATRAGFEKAVRDDKATPPASGGGYYWTGTRTAYLYRQPTAYYTRTLMLHEAGHQFHYLARTRNLGPSSGWYAEGVVEYLAWHTWDGETLRLGEVPLSLKDYPAKALADLEAGKISLKALADGTKGHRPLGTVLVRYLYHGEKGRLRRPYAALAARLDGRLNAAKAFRAVLGDPARLQPRLLAWLRANQEPWTQVFNTWVRIGPGRFHGEAKGVFSLARLKVVTPKLSATMRVPPKGRWRGGLVLGCKSGKAYVVATVDSGGRVRVDQRANGRWRALHASAAPPAAKAGERKLAASRDSEGVTFVVDGKRYGPFTIPGEPFGLVVNDSALEFTDVRWTDVAPKR